MALNKTTSYPLADRIPLDQCQSLGIDKWSLGKRYRYVRARWTGERRPPRAGEWFLSGAEINAYRASNDLDHPYHIAELVIVIPGPDRIVSAAEVP